MTDNLYLRIRAILAARSKTADFTRDVLLQDDGKGPYIRAWDEAALGPRPTQEQLATAERAALAAIAAKQKIAAIEAETGFTRRQREFIVANGDEALKAALSEKEAEIVAERGKLR